VNQASSAGLRSPFTPATAYRLTCEINPLDTVDELIASYRLRHEVYGALGYLQRFPSDLEIDSYDAYSIAFGASDRVSGEMIGTLRMNRTQQGVCQSLWVGPRRNMPPWWCATRPIHTTTHSKTLHGER
jgi:hypothetical protein